jgi:hypothetical protein
MTASQTRTANNQELTGMPAKTTRSAWISALVAFTCMIYDPPACDVMHATHWQRPVRQPLMDIAFVFSAKTAAEIYGLIAIAKKWI